MSCVGSIGTVSVLASPSSVIVRFRLRRIRVPGGVSDFGISMWTACRGPKFLGLSLRVFDHVCKDTDDVLAGRRGITSDDPLRGLECVESVCGTCRHTYTFWTHEETCKLKISNSVHRVPQGL